MSRVSLANFRRWKRSRSSDAIASRRDVLRSAISATQATMLAPLFHRSGRSAVNDSAGRVIVVGAGLAGLMAAYELSQAGYDVQIFEARDRVGGRVLSFNRWLQGQTIEGGGELIGLNHPRWWALADAFDLELVELPDEEDVDYPILLDGKLLGFRESERLYEQMDEAFASLNALAEPIDADQPWRSPNATELDRASVADWMKPMPWSDRLRKAIAVQLASDNAVANDQASLLGLLTAIRGGGLEDYWSMTETHRCRNGNQQLATKLWEAVGRERVRLSSPVSSIRWTEHRASVILADGTLHEAEDVILTVPPSTWHRIRFDPALPRDLVPQVGTAIKYLARTKRPVWTDLKLASELLTDDFVSQTWSATNPTAKNRESESVLVAFSGGPQAARALGISESDRDSAYRQLLDQGYSGFDKQFIESRMMDWPNDSWTRCGYSFPSPGQITSQGPRLRDGIGRLHFAGEHTCFAFVGYMEGALKSGADVAMQLAVRDGLAQESPR